MGLLKLKGSGECNLTGDLIENIPLYAIFSHIWGEDNEVIAINAFMRGVGKSKTATERSNLAEDKPREIAFGTKALF
jgi:hypothetical protein